MEIPVHNIDISPSVHAPESAPLHIASLIAHVQQASIADVARWLEQQPGVEIHAQSPQGKFAIVMECHNERDVVTLLDTLEQRQGVLNTALIYHEIIDGEDDA